MFVVGVLGGKNVGTGKGAQAGEKSNGMRASLPALTGHEQTCQAVLLKTRNTAAKMGHGEPKYSSRLRCPKELMTFAS